MLDALSSDGEEPADDRYDIVVGASGDEQKLVLKHGETFAVCDRHGDIVPHGLNEQGLYYEGTRFLSRFVLALGSRRPLLLHATVLETNDILTADLTNPDLSGSGEVQIREADADGNASSLAHGTLHLSRTRFLWRGVAYERIQITNHGTSTADVPLHFEFAADYADIFEVRGLRRKARGELLESECGEGRVVLGYRGIDDRHLRTDIHFSATPESLAAHAAHFRVRLAPGASDRIDITIRCRIGDSPAIDSAFEAAKSLCEAELAARQSGTCQITTSNEQFNAWINRSVADLLMLVSETPEGPYPYAGVPWYSTVFGRDGILTAMEWLWANPRLARGVLLHLAATQATEVDLERDAAPGKILHERRSGEMAALGEIPFGRYYGTIDATPLFIVLAGAYHQRTGDDELIRQIWPRLEAALQWIDDFGDCDGDGFVEYQRTTEEGLSNQGWKDSWDSISHADGRLAEAPIALAEVQGYVYAAWRHAAKMAAMLGFGERATLLENRAEELRERFDEKFWLDELGCYAMALDGTKEPTRVVGSNAGHCLFTGIAKPERARRLADTLLTSHMFSGWGIRTLDDRAKRYNPMSYHNGSIWPHDNAIIAAGLARYGLMSECQRIAGALFDVSVYVDLHRLPELYCGFPRREARGPVLYPVACAPQAWAAGACFMLLEGMLGLSIDARARRLTLRWPMLPPFLNFVRLQNLDVGGSKVDLLLERHPADVSVRILSREEEVEIVVVK